MSRHSRRAAATLVLALLLGLLALPGTALAAVDPPCDGWAEFNGTRWTPANDTASNPIIVPPDTDVLQVRYFGTSGFDNNGHSGEIHADLVVSIPIASWEDTNGDLPNEPSKEGTYTVDLAEVREKARFEPRGLVRVSGSHSAGGNSCSGFVMVKFDGAIFDSVLASTAAGGMLLTFLLLILATVVTGNAAAAGVTRGRPILGAVSGLVFGLSLAIFLQQASILPLQTATLLGLPGLFLLVGFGLGWFAPLGRGRVSVVAGGGGPTPPPEGTGPMA